MTKYEELSDKNDIFNIEPRNIYNSISEYLKNIENKLSTLSNNKDIDMAKNKAYKLVSSFKNKEFDKEVKELKKSEEWDTFTIAFYGETNAGKSTILEALRIFFKEKTKLEAQNKFKQYHLDFRNQKKIIEQETLKIELRIEDYTAQRNKLLNNYEKKKTKINNEIEDLGSIHIEKLTKSFLYKILNFFNMSLIIRDIGVLSNILQKDEESYKKLFNDIEINIEKEKNSSTDLKNKFIYLNEKYTVKFEEVSDGKIIGDGRADFTQKAISYLIEYNNQKFAFLDIPGIEGKESKVIDEVTLAVKKAHVVFYVTSNSTPPQKGDDNKKGTLEKIKEHLSSQTEVYTIFNKRITSPRQLNGEIVNNNELASLEILNTKMREILGLESYRDNINLSAKIAFLALSKSVSPFDKDTNKNKDKFLEKFTSEKLLDKVQFNHFTNFLTNDLIINTKNKIKKSNYNKANEVLESFISILFKASEDIFQPLYKELKSELADVSDNFFNTLSSSEKMMESKIEKYRRKFVTDTRTFIYEYINSDKSDKEFEIKLKEVIKEQAQTCFETELPKSLDKDLENLQNEVKDVLVNYQRRVNLLFEDFNDINLKTDETSFSFKIDLDNGIDGWGIFGSLVGAGGLVYATIMSTNAWNPLGWAMFSIGVLTVLIGLGKSIFKFFSTDYKKSQQKKVADENIDKISKEIKKSILKNLKKSILVFKDKLSIIIDSLEDGIKQVKHTDDYVMGAYYALLTLSNKIKEEGKINESNS